MKAFFAILPFAYFACSLPAVSISDLKSAFVRPEYIASNDGWAEARRRRLLKKYLQARGIPFSESTAPLRGKYNRVTLHAGDRRVKARRVTLSLPPGPGVAVAQATCDKKFFSQLEAEIRSVDFVMTHECVVDR